MIPRAFASGSSGRIGMGSTTGVMIWVAALMLQELRRPADHSRLLTGAAA